MTWRCWDYLDVDDSVHVVPNDDLIGHELTDCVDVEPCPREPFGWGLVNG